MKYKFESLEEKVRRHLRIPLKQKLQWLGQMFEFNSKNQLKLRKQLRAIGRNS